MPHAVRDSSSPSRIHDGLPSPSRPKRPLKRTASEALPPTPPRTVKRERKRRVGKRSISRTSKSRSQSRASKHDSEHDVSDNKEEQHSLGEGIGRRLDFGPLAKRRRLEDLDARLETLLEAPDDEENPFWDGPSKPKPGVTGITETTDKGDAKESLEKTKNTEKGVRIRSPTPPLVSFHGKALASPPPSNRRKKGAKGKASVSTVEAKPESGVEPSAEASLELLASAAAGSSANVEDEVPLEKAEESSTTAVDKSDETEEPLPTVELPLPSTPKKGKARLVDSPVRDSPNNPFLDDSPPSVSGEPAEPRTTTTRPEKPTITYIFRGVRAEFANPMYNLPPEVHERSLLPIEHPDFSPDPACPPKLLFTKPRRRVASPSPTRKGKSKGEARSKSAAPSGSRPDNEWDDSDDEAELHITPPKRLFH
ncbi:uncharacterized protein FOMMEDRAFT_17748 [Fomitiporia mediterranea MF3/22]|uniref:uncharacterized protein n=1 Tax=Fomitiporia mediterranea (strain MF3/22) TaxID=694068 RepID=UPI000440994E|nr:uncharacterized protein FOMMEDRAFT_17748 [Fomitiporia mediterranea MF3/22]EJD05450.1 hypothetical protein FOMMEDRAFT_17748 [Fomitiporia mediterranea MF3/22]